MRYASRVVAFYSGRILADGAPATVLADPRCGATSRAGVKRETVLEISSSGSLSPRCTRCAASRCRCPPAAWWSLVGRNGAGKTSPHAHGDGPPRGELGRGPLRRRRPRAPCRATRARAWASATCPRTAAWCPSSRWRRTSSCRSGCRRRSGRRMPGARLRHPARAARDPRAPRAAPSGRPAEDGGARARARRRYAPAAADEPFEGLAPALSQRLVGGHRGPARYATRGPPVASRT